MASKFVCTFGFAVAALLVDLSPVWAQGPNCTRAVETSAYALIVNRQDRAAQAAVKRDVPAAWSRRVVTECPGLDPSWSRARKKKLRSCGYRSSSNRYSCPVSAVPARKRR
jgi:hypothetical protein